MPSQLTATSTTDSKESVEQALGATRDAQAKVETDLKAAETAPETTPEGETPPAEGETTPELEVETPPAATIEAKPEETADDEDDDEPPASKPSRKDRIGRLKWQRYQLQQENERLQAQLVQLNTPPPKIEETKAPTFGTPKPKLDHYPTIEAWTEALSDWTESKLKFDIDQRDLAARSRIETDSRTRAESALVSRHLEREAEFKKTHPDFDAVKQEARELGIDKRMTDPMNTHILHSEVGPQLMVYFVQHPEEVDRIAAMNFGPALVALGRLEAKLDAEPPPPARAAATTAPAAKAIPKPAPKPIRPVGSSATASEFDPNDPSASQAQFKAWRLAQQRASQGR